MRAVSVSPASDNDPGAAGERETTMSDETVYLPTVLLKMSGHTFRDSGSNPVPWDIYGEAETDDAIRARVTVNGRVVADVTVHPNGNNVAREAQEVCAALLWSAIRRWANLNHLDVSTLSP